MRKLTIVAICTCLVFLFIAGTVVRAADIHVQGFLFLYTKTCEEAQLCTCDSPNDVVVTGGAVCSEGKDAIPFVYVTSSGPTCVVPAGTRYVGCLDPSHVPNAWYAECGQCFFSVNADSESHCSVNLFPVSVTITCLRG